MDEKQRVVLAYSGGLDTSFCIPFLREKYGVDVITATVDTGGFSDEYLKEMEKNSQRLGALKHRRVDARENLYHDFITYLIKGNVLKGGTYPLSVGAERVIQAVEIVKIAREEGAVAIAHGSTPAGNDQVRFDVAFGVLAPEFRIMAPVREFGITRETETGFLAHRGFPVKEENTRYSYNSGLWGTTIGGGETHGSQNEVPDDAYTQTRSVREAPDEPAVLELGFREGVPVSLDGEVKHGLEIIEHLNQVGGIHGYGRGIHIGDTIMGIKGRIAFEAPAPLILIGAHRELEKLVLTKWQRYWKDQLGDFYGMMLHEGMYFDPVVGDIMAFLDSSQKKVTGNVRVKLFKGSMTVIGCTSPYSMMDGDTAVYGESASLWDGTDAKGFCSIYGIPSILAKRAEERGAGADEG